LTNVYTGQNGETQFIYFNFGHWAVKVY